MLQIHGPPHRWGQWQHQISSPSVAAKSRRSAGIALKVLDQILGLFKRRPTGKTAVRDSVHCSW